MACSSDDAPKNASKEASPRPPATLQGATPVAWQACTCPVEAPAAGAIAPLTHGPVLGGVSDRSIKVWARSTMAAQLIVRIARSDGAAGERCSAPVPFVDGEDHTAVAYLDGLEPATSYDYRLQVQDGAGKCLPWPGHARSFRTLPAAGKPARVRFAVGADVRGDNVPGFAEIAGVKPDFVLMIGDNVYADDDGFVSGNYDASFKRYQRLYQRVWGGAQFHKLFATTPVFMAWDDHEIMENYWRGKDPLRYAVARALFDSYQANHNPNPIEKGELYFSFQAGDVGFFMLDVRTHRDDNEAVKRLDPKKTMLGTAQRDALLKWLASDGSRVRVLVSPVIVSTFRTTGADAWRAFDAERTAILDAIAAHPERPTFIVSGDQHWSAVLRIDQGADDPAPIYEFQTTPLGSGTRAAPENINDRVLALDNTHRVFAVFDVDTLADPPRFDFTLCAVGTPCRPGEEPAPQSIDAHTARLPYGVAFTSGPRGFVMQPTAPETK